MPNRNGLVTNSGGRPLSGAELVAEPDYRRDYPMTTSDGPFVEGTDEIGRNEIRVSIQTTNDLRLDAIQLIQRALDFIPEREHARVLHYVLEGIENVRSFES